METKGAIKVLGGAFHRAVARSRPISATYFKLLPFVVKRLPNTMRQQIRNSIFSVHWAPVTLPVQTICVGNGTRIRLRPHLQEFDFEALLSDRLGYEPELFAFIEKRIGNYDVAIEIGANVGVFTVFISVAAKLHSHPLKVYAFEPSRRAYARLLENIDLNGLTHLDAFNCAVSDLTGFVDFFEPEGHFTNGSLDEEFASQFSAHIQRRRIFAVNGELVDALVSSKDRLLLKIDVEGAEPKVLNTLEPLMRRVRPDLVVEVLAPVADDLNRIRWLKELGYQFFHLTPYGPVERDQFEAFESRDYFLTTHEIRAAPAVATDCSCGVDISA